MNTFAFSSSHSLLLFLVSLYACFDAFFIFIIFLFSSIFVQYFFFRWFCCCHFSIVKLDESRVNWPKSQSGEPTGNKKSKANIRWNRRKSKSELICAQCGLCLAFFRGTHTHTQTYDLYQDVYAANISAIHFRISAAIKPFMAYSICINGIVPQYLRHGLCNSALRAPFFAVYVYYGEICCSFFLFVGLILSWSLSRSFAMCVSRSVFFFSSMHHHQMASRFGAAAIAVVLPLLPISSFNPDYLVGCLNVRY